MIKKINLLVLSVIFTFSGFCAYGQEAVKVEKLMSMSLEELLSVKIDIGTLTGIELSKLPLSLTTITAEDIKYTPARNIYDLIEVYVPGALWMNHVGGPHLAVRGLINEANYKYLLLVNGRNMNTKADLSGAKQELENWDMSDIEKIEIIRGPGSVTYGPGAVAGIINITTKNADGNEGTEIRAIYNPTYQSKGVSYSHGIKKDNFDFYLHQSITSTKGLSITDAFQTGWKNETGYVGRDFVQEIFLASPPLDYFRDFDDKPQIKINAELNFLNEWTLRARYNNTGMSRNGVDGQYRPQLGLDENGDRIYGDWQNQQQNENRYLGFSLENNHEFSESLNLKSLISWDTEHITYRRNFSRYGVSDSLSVEEWYDFADKNFIKNTNRRFGEEELLIRTIANYQFRESYKIALGLEYSRNHWGPGWGDGERDLRMGDAANIISGPNSNAYGFKGVGDNGYFVGDGWSTNMYSIFGEANLEFHPQFIFLLSGRIDKDSYSNFLFSPRVAFVSEFNQKNVIKLILQQAQRMNTAQQLFVLHTRGIKSEPETLSGIELMYSRLQSENLLLYASVFYNKVEVLGWANDDQTLPVGDLSLYGLELEGRYNFENGYIGFNHSYVKQIDWNYAAGVSYSGISYKDFKRTMDMGTYTGLGNDINNWSNQATKCFACFNLLDNKFVFHTDARVFWGFEGAKDGLEMARISAIGTEKEDDVSNAVEDLKRRDAYGIDFRLNSSLTFTVNKTFSITCYVMNLLGSGKNKRYSYDNGHESDWLAPDRADWVEEPRTFGFRLTADL